MELEQYIGTFFSSSCSLSLSLDIRRRSSNVHHQTLAHRQCMRTMRQTVCAHHAADSVCAPCGRQCVCTMRQTVCAHMPANMCRGFAFSKMLTIGISSGSLRDGVWGEMIMKEWGAREMILFQYDITVSN